MNIVIKISQITLQQTPNEIHTTTGASVSFLGIIKKKNNNKEVKEVHYFIFDKLFISILKKYCISILKNKKEIEIYVNQYVGIAHIGAINLIISVQAKDRKNAFSICHKVLEFIKNNAPVWKKEIYVDGTSVWINA